MVGSINDLVNAQNLKLELTNANGTGAPIGLYIMLQELDFHLGRPEAREPTTDSGVQYFYGKGDHYFDSTILLTTSEVPFFNAFTELNSNGDLPTLGFNVIAQPRGGGNNIEIAVNAQLPDFNIIKPVEGGVIFRIRFRIIDDDVTVNTVAP